MRMRGLEPPRGCPHTALNRARLPIPPHPLAADSVCHSAGAYDVRLEAGLPLRRRCAVRRVASGPRGQQRSRTLDQRGRRGRRAARRARQRPERVRRPPARGCPSGQGALARTGPCSTVLTVVLPRTELAGLRSRPGVAEVYPSVRYSPTLYASPGFIGAPVALGARPRLRRERNQDRDHRRRHRPHAPVLPDRGLPDAAWISEGPARVHDRQGDRRPGVRSREAALAARAPSLRPDLLRACDARGGNRGRQQRARAPVAGSCPASRRRPTSATTRC